MSGLLVLIASSLLPAHAAPTELEIAYQREFAYLQAERTALRERLSGIASESAQRIAATEGEISQLQARLLELQGQVAEQEELLLAAGRDAEAVHGARELVDVTLFQASASLDRELPEAETSEQQAEALQLAFTAGAAKLATAGTITREPGTYFLPDGTQVEGEILRLGRIAAYGVGPRSGALRPLGEGKLQLRDDAAASVATRLSEGRRPDTLGLFAFEDTGKRVEEAEAKTLLDTLEAGGVVGMVIIALGIVGVLLSILRGAGLWLAGRGSAVANRILDLLDGGRWDEALQLAKAAPGATPRMLAAVLPLGPRSPKRLEERASEAILRETPGIERFGTAILVIAAVAPLLGLLGTVTGMIGTFEIITEFGTGDPRMLSGGISEALVTTQLGLIVAIPTLLIGNLLNQAANRVLNELEITALGVINRASAPTAQRPGAEAPSLVDSPSLSTPDDRPLVTHG